MVPIVIDVCGPTVPALSSVVVVAVVQVGLLQAATFKSLLAVS